MHRAAMLHILTLLILGAPAAGCGGQPRTTLAGGKPVSAWVSALQSPDPQERRKSLAKLGNVGNADPAALPAVIHALRDRDATVRREAVLALVKFGSAAREAIPVLEAMTNDSDMDVRTDALKVLARLRS